MRILVLLLISLSSALAQAECRLTLPRAGFADAISEREPVGDGSAPGERLWFFTEVMDGAGETLYHQWYRNGEEDVRIRLPIGADRWRTWSGHRWQAGERYTVRVLTESGCDLGEYGLMAQDSGSDVLASARAALASGDLLGARMQVRTAQEDGNQSPALRRFIDEELALAELEKDIAADNLYVAGGRLDSLRQRALSATDRARLETLGQRHAERTASLESDMKQRLMALQRTLAGMPAATSCQSAVENTDWLPEPERQILTITGQESADHKQLIDLIDQRTGKLHRIERPCL